jgi:predicted ABC-type ATPase
MARPVLYVLAGVNGAGKSSIGGHALESVGTTWFNPDVFARGLMAKTGCSQAEANATAWQEGMRLLDEAVEAGRPYAFETTLGGHTVAARIRAAAATHDVFIRFTGLSSPDLHIQRVRARVVAGGHDIPDAKIRERYPRALVNLIALMPHLAHLQVYDNSVEAARGTAVPDPVLVLEMEGGAMVWPRADDVETLAATPDWAKPLLAAALADSGA